LGDPELEQRIDERAAERPAVLPEEDRLALERFDRSLNSVLSLAVAGEDRDWAR
jgi:hypothetical protein